MFAFFDKRRTQLTILAVFLLFVGLLGWLMSFSDAFRRIERFETQSPLHLVVGIAVDSNGNIYYGSGQHSSIQVYNNKGNFLYGFSFPTNGAFNFTFYIDDADYIHIAIASDYMYTFYNGELISGPKDTADEASHRLNEYSEQSQNAKEFQDREGNIYKITNGKRVKMYDGATGEYIRTIIPNAPIWPFSIIAFWCIFAVGMILLFLCNREIFKALNLKRTFKSAFNNGK